MRTDQDPAAIDTGEQPTAATDAGSDHPTRGPAARPARATRRPASRPPDRRRSPTRTRTRPAAGKRSRRRPDLAPVRVEPEILAPDGPHDEARLRRAQTEVLRDLTRWLEQQRDATGGAR